MASRSPIQTAASLLFNNHPMLSEDHKLNQDWAPFAEHEATNVPSDTDNGESLVLSQDSSIDSQITDDHGAVDSNEDLADQLDAEALEALQQLSNLPPTNFGMASSHPKIDVFNDTQSSAPPPPHSGVTVNSETSQSAGSHVIIDLFPFGQPGVPIPTMQQSSSVYEATHNSLGNSIWAPFQSQIDWEFAHWAKMCGPTSTAVTDLLAIPEVSPHWLVLIASLTPL
jgi:hypothetical protein